jgi:hypothetical protein
LIGSSLRLWQLTAGQLEGQGYSVAIQTQENIAPCNDQVYLFSKC